MRSLDNIINLRETNLPLYEKLIECNCNIFINHKCVYEGKYDRKFATSLDNPEQALVIFDLNEGYAIMTIAKNNSLNKVIEIFTENQDDYDKVMNNPKLYNQINNLLIDLPEMPTIVEGNNLERLYKFLVEDDESIPGDGLPDKNEKKEKKNLKRRGEIQFTIWENPEKKISWLDSNYNYQKIEYVYTNKNKGLNIDFLLGYQDGTWKLWAGKVGSVSYDDDPYCDLEEHKFDKAIIKALDKVEEMIDDIQDNPDDWPQFYINI
ncbi:MAG: hypothetical protein J1F35_03680 [Erysipelotrichales bacterium]|nr:hypothetical protein [Erysipelotrichales bacterium]